MKDDKFKRPKAYISMKYYTNDCMLGRTPLGKTFVEMWTAFVKEYLREYFYMAEMASLKASLSALIDNF
jgi:hypothetical protein